MVRGAARGGVRWVCNDEWFRIPQKQFLKNNFGDFSDRRSLAVICTKEKVIVVKICFTVRILLSKITAMTSESLR